MRLPSQNAQIGAMSNPHDIPDDLALALRAARAAGEVVLRFFGHDTPVEYKSPDQPVTEADLLANRTLLELLIGERPEYGWLSEETADSRERLARDRVWIVDPIDGTRSFIQGHPEYAICIGLAAAGEAVVGVVLNPSTGEMYHATLGGGAFRNGVPIRVAAARGTAEAASLFVSRSEIARGEFEPLRSSWNILPLGSTAYKMVKVADGTGAAFLSRGPKSEWDICAPALIVTEAGGRVSTLAGETLRYNQPAPFMRGIIVSNGEAHPELLRRVAALAPVAHGSIGGE